MTLYNSFPEANSAYNRKQREWKPDVERVQVNVLVPKVCEQALKDYAKKLREEHYTKLKKQSLGPPPIASDPSTWDI